MLSRARIENRKETHMPPKGHKFTGYWPVLFHEVCLPRTNSAFAYFCPIFVACRYEHTVFMQYIHVCLNTWCHSKLVDPPNVVQSSLGDQIC